MARGAETRYGTVSDWMTREPARVGDDCRIREALDRMRREDVRHLLVFQGDRLVGLLSNRDLRRLPLEAPRAADPVSRIMTEGPITAAPEMPVEEAARLLLEHKIGALPVREGEEILGIFTISDALEALLAVAQGPSR
jgi:acetoin utilization protein AcuB